MPTFCVPPLSSLPGSPASDFDWWVLPPNAAEIRYYPDNPNWLGAFGLSAGDGANEDIKFRCLKGNLAGKNRLLLQWIVRTSTLNNSIDRVNVLIGVPGAAKYLAFSAQLVNPATTSASPPGTENNGVFSYRLQQCNQAGGAITAVPGFITDSVAFEETARMWVSVTSPTRLLQTDWAFQIAIPLGENWGEAPATVNLPASGAFKLWFEVWPSILNNAVPQQWPTTAPATASSTSIIPPGGINESQMLDMATGGVCDDSVKLSWGSIGTRAVPGGAARPDNNTIKLDLGKPYPPLSAPYDTNHTPDASNVEHQNQFFAKPTLPAGISDPQKQSLRARFSIANWGSQLSESTAASWRPIDRGTNVNFDLASSECRVVWPLPADVGAPGSFLVNLVRNINAYLNAWAASAPFPPGSQSPHQCMLVELSSLDPSVIITTTSVYTNMNVANASTFRRFAEISVVGATPISVQPRDVYLYVQKFNMPPVVKHRETPPPSTTFNAEQPNFGVLNRAAASTGGVRGHDVEDIAALVPTYTVHGYMDTGKKYELADGSKVPILRRQTSFGYFVLHEGDLHGWETRLYGAEKLAEDVYIVRVPNNGSVHVETAVQARESANETPLPPDGRPTEGVGKKPHGCLAAILHLFGRHKKTSV